MSWSMRDCLNCDERTPHYGETVATERCVICGGN